MGVYISERNNPTDTTFNFNSCIISDNESQRRCNGGGIYALGSTSKPLKLNLNGCIISDNIIKKTSAQDEVHGGAGLCLLYTDANINNCVLARNKAFDTNGGAISIAQGTGNTITLNNSKLYNN